MLCSCRHQNAVLRNLVLQHAKDCLCDCSPYPPCPSPSIEYLPCFAAAGTRMRFYAISRANGLVTRPRPVSPTYDLSTTVDRAFVVMATVKFYQLLRAQRALYPADVLPAGAVQCARGQGFKREL